MRRLFPGLLPLVFCFSACKRDPALTSGPAVVDFGQGTGRCRLIFVTETPLADTARHSVKELHYDVQGRLQYVANQQYSGSYPASYSFTYHGDTIITARASRQTDTMVMNQAGMPLYIYTTGSSTPSLAQGGNILLYDTQNRLAGARSDGFSSGEDSYYTWAGSDLRVDSQTYGRSYTYDYYSGKPSQYANPVTLPQYLFFGIPVWHSAHLPRYRSYTSYPLYNQVFRDTFLYAFDGDGKIVADTIRGAGGSTLNTFSYECK